MRLRVLISLTNGHVPADTYALAAAEEPPISGRAKACAGCPLRRGGEWEAGAQTALREATAAQKELLSKRWGCHAASRPCAGMRRLTNSKGSL